MKSSTTLLLLYTYLGTQRKSLPRDGILAVLIVSALSSNFTCTRTCCVADTVQLIQLCPRRKLGPDLDGEDPVGAEGVLGGVSFGHGRARAVAQAHGGGQHVPAGQLGHLAVAFYRHPLFLVFNTD